MYIIPAITLLLTMLCTLLCAVIGRTLYDKILAVNTLGTLTTLFIAVFGFFTARPDFLDIALVYALINFITTIAILRFSEYGSIGQDADDEQEPEI